MAGIGAFFRLDGAQLDARQVERTAGALRWRGPDGFDRWSDDACALLHAHSWTTPEELSERQPIGSPAGCRITGDVRLDNRDTLLPQLHPHLVGERQAAPSDAELVLAAYERWGDECPGRLIGDFSFIIWDAPRRRIFCGRDPMGSRPLHYWCRGGLFCAASDVGSLLAGLEREPAIHLPFLEDWLANRWDRAHHETAYAGVLRLPAGYSLVVERSGPQLHRYWTLGAQPPARLEDERDYFQAFHELLTRAVSDRMRSVHRVALAVSGGLDSSALACVADEVARENLLVGDHRPLLLSAVFDRTPSADERQYLDLVIDACPALEPKLVSGDDCWAYREFGADRDFPLVEPEPSASRAITAHLQRSAHAAGCRVLLSGQHADQVLVGQPYHRPHLLADVALADVRQELPHFCRSSRRSVWGVLAAAGLAPLLPASVRDALRALRARGGTEGRSAVRPPSREPLLLPDPLSPPPLAGRSAQHVYRACTDGRRAMGLVSTDLLAHQNGIEGRAPFTDRRLIEFLLAIPRRVRFSDGQFKRILVEAMAGRMPEVVRQRKTFSHFGDLMQRGRECERERLQSLLSESRIVAHSLLEQEALDRLKQDWALGPAGQIFRGAEHVLAIEAWLRHREEEEPPRVANGPVVGVFKPGE